LIFIRKLTLKLFHFNNLLKSIILKINFKRKTHILKGKFILIIFKILLSQSIL